jgi:valyl-tRNA synthetase
LELIKPLMNGDAGSAIAAGGNISAAQTLSRHILYLCLDHGLKLLHPIMPFVTEELWQRLPGRGLAWRKNGNNPDPASIMIAPWPQPLRGLTRPDVDAAFYLFQNVLRAGRNLRADADVPWSKEAVYYIATTASTEPMVREFHRDFMTLLKASDLHVVRAQSEVEAGSSVSVVNDALSIHLVLKGLIDPAAEISKLTKKEGKLHAEIERVTKKMSGAAYQEKSPAEVRAADIESIAAARRQLEVLAGLKEQYSSWLA